ncbi:MAG TPA: succinate dehydrogenase iron-sulfur subunit, partial [Candidatus Limnocylindrales bacterium]
MQVDLRILRFDPERDAAPHWESYRVDAEPMDRVLNLLISVKADQDGTLTFRRSCAHGICGSDAMLINGRNRLACKIRVDQLGRKITVAPLTGLPVMKDLVVDMDGFLEKYRSVMPFLIADTPPPERERRQSPADRARYDDTTKCILCAACTTACPSFWAQPSYVGPAAIVNAHRF